MKIENLKLQAWDYYAHDILNAVYLQADYKWPCLLNGDMTMKASASSAEAAITVQMGSPLPACCIGILMSHSTSHLA